MSQIQSYPAISGGGTGPILTLTGNTGGAVPPTAGNIDIVGDGTTVTVTGTPGTSTLLISLIGQALYTGTTPSNLAVTIATFPILSGQSIAVFCEGVAQRADVSASLAITGTAAARCPLGTAILEGVPDIDPVTSALFPTLVFAVSGSDLLVQISGEVATVWNWTLLIRTLYQS